MDWVECDCVKALPNIITSTKDWFSFSALLSVVANSSTAKETVIDSL